MTICRHRSNRSSCTERLWRYWRSAKLSAKEEAQRGDATVAAAPPSSDAAAAAAAPAAAPAGERDGSSGAAVPLEATTSKAPVAEAHKASGSDTSPRQQNRESTGEAAADSEPGAAAGGEAGGPAAAAALPRPPPAVKHTDAVAKEAARERYLARKKRQAAGEPDV